jgi:hypothetical protein
VSRWTTPQAAAKEEATLRKEKLKSRLTLIGVIQLMIATTMASFVFYAFPRLKNPHRHQHQHGGSTDTVPPERKP